MEETTVDQPAVASQAQRAYDLIRAEVISCNIRPGETVIQRELASRYNLGLTPVREALHRLAQDGYLTPVPRLGYMVNTITVRDLREQYELREILEVAAARWAAVRATAEHLAAIEVEAQWTYRYGDRSSYAHFLGHNTRFHQMIATASGNSKLADAVARVLDEQLRIFHLGLDLRDAASEMREEHTALTRALLDRDPDCAERLIVAQVRRSRERIEEALILGGDRFLQGLELGL
jgi:DNA-binding GntR family transcriptional regulator